MSGLGEVRPVSVPGAGAGDVHLFTVDVEEYFQVSAFDGVVSRGDWDALPSRIERQVDLLLDILAEHEVRATFFILGWVAKRHPLVVRRIAARGHEVASHGWHHRRITTQSHEEFREDVRRSRKFLEDLTGRPVLGFRAANFSLLPGSEWALDVLLEEGYRYDSSLFPVGWLRRGYRGAPRFQSWIRRSSGELLELPICTRSWSWSRRRIPAGGGNYFRQLPYGLTSSALAEAGEAGASGVFYVHPWELDPHQPRVSVPPLTKLRHYRNLDGMVPRLNRLLRDFAFTSVEDRFRLHARPEDDEAARAASPA